MGVLEGLRSPGHLRPALIFLLTAMATGILVTFLPLAMRGAGKVAALALLANTAATTVARWTAGHYGARRDQARLLLEGTAAAALGLLALALFEAPAVAVAGAVLLGLGFGLAQNASLTLMFDRVSAAGYAMVSAIYNLAYDAGLGLGAAGFGVLAVRTGYAYAFVLTAALMLLLVAPVWRNRAWLAPEDALRPTSL